jgi:hypothetical protein
MIEFLFVLRRFAIGGLAAKVSGLWMFYPPTIKPKTGDNRQDDDHTEEDDQIKVYGVRRRWNSARGGGR